VTGENPPYGAGPQPAGREPAPGELALVQAFVNTHFDLAAGGGETLASPEALRAWLSERGLLASARPVDGRDLDRVLAVREGSARSPSPTTPRT
jgi:Putative stress-induced transcription regulator